MVRLRSLYRIVLSVASFAFLVVLLAFVVTPIFFVQMFLAVGDVVTDVTDGGVPANATVEVLATAHAHEPPSFFLLSSACPSGWILTHPPSAQCLTASHRLVYGSRCGQ